MAEEVEVEDAPNALPLMALILAMSFHEKGRAALKKKRYDFALVLLLNASDEYGKLGDSDNILSRADNYALLNLDIAWCYLKLGDLSQLPDAEQRLIECKMKLQRSYGTDMQRVVAIKGSADKERALYLRLQLLQGIVAFHQGTIHKGRPQNFRNFFTLPRLHFVMK